MLTFIFDFFDTFGYFSESLFVVVFVVQENHEKVNVVSSIPLLKGDLCLLLKFVDSIDAAQTQKIFLNENNEISLSVLVPFLFAHSGLSF